MVHSRTGILSRLRHHREDAAARHQLERELARFTTPADQLELELIAARHADEDGRQIEQILRAQRTRQLFTR